METVQLGIVGGCLSLYGSRAEGGSQKTCAFNVQRILAPAAPSLELVLRALAPVEVFSATLRPRQRAEARPSELLLLQGSAESFQMNRKAVRIKRIQRSYILEKLVEFVVDLQGCASILTDCIG